MKTIWPRRRAILSCVVSIALFACGLRLIWSTYELDAESALAVPAKKNGHDKNATKTSPPEEANSASDHAVATSRDPKNELLQRLGESLGGPPMGGVRSNLIGDAPGQSLVDHQQLGSSPGVRSPLNSTGYPMLYNGRFVPTRRIVHLDLKGAPPKVHYFQEFFRLIGRLGATGILIEWEDMFPYTGELTECRNGNAYSEADVRTILKWAKENNLEIIPLVQTFGHLEWVLKHEKFAHLREVERYAQVICLSNPDAVSLVKTIIDQVLSMHEEFGGTYFHMGADEAFQVGMCEICSKAIKEKYSGSRDNLMLHHINTIAGYVKDKYSRRVLMWHDMLDHVDTAALNASGIGQFVEPVVWAYVDRVTEYVRLDMWNKFSQTFPFVWAASAFKGADGPDRFHSNVLHYMRNHFSWSQAMTDQYEKFKEFRGIILTGWQRFDHFAVLCELLPVGFPSLAINLQIALHGGQLSKEVLNATSRILGCSSDINVNAQVIPALGCQFPGYQIYFCVQQLKQVQDQTRESVFNEHAARGWMGQFNVRHNYSSAWYLDQISRKATYYLTVYEGLAKILKVELSQVFHEDAVEEFMLEYVDADVQKLMEVRRDAERLANLRVFPARPFPIIRAKQAADETTTAVTKVP